MFDIKNLVSDLYDKGTEDLVKIGKQFRVYQKFERGTGQVHLFSPINIDDLCVDKETFIEGMHHYTSEYLILMRQFPERKKIYDLHRPKITISYLKALEWLEQNPKGFVYTFLKCPPFSQGAFGLEEIIIGCYFGATQYEIPSSKEDHAKIFGFVFDNNISS